MEIKIKKAKLSKGGTVETSYTDVDGNEIMLKGKNKCHNDLRVAFARLVPFFADLTEQKEADSIDWNDIESAANVELLRKMDVTGISIGGDDNNPIITMTGKRTLFTSRILNLNAPGVEMNSESFEWGHVDDFDVAIQEVLYEVKEYVISRKWEVIQPELNFDGNSEDPFGDVAQTNDVQPVEHPVESVA